VSQSRRDEPHVQHHELTLSAESSLSDDESDDGEDSEDEEERRKFAFPELDAKMRETVKRYGAIFPKLNFSSPRVSIYSAHSSLYRS
jgi:hypothetical protein